MQMQKQNSVQDSKSNNNIQPNNETQQQEAVQPKKRGRGRPKKEDVPVITAEDLRKEYNEGTITAAQWEEQTFEVWQKALQTFTLKKKQFAKAREELDLAHLNWMEADETTK